MSVRGYNGWFAPQRTPRQGHFDKSGLDVFRTIVSHVRRSVDIMLSLRHQATANQDLLDAMDQLTIGILFLDSNCRIILANEAAQKIVREQDGLCAVNGALCAGRHTERKTLECAMAEAQKLLSGNARAAQEPLRISRPSGKSPFSITVVPLSRSSRIFEVKQAGMLVCIADPEQATVLTHQIAPLYDLTPAEARLAAAMANGETLETYCKSANLKPGTARSTLKRIFDKTGTSRQAELVRELLVRTIP